MSRLVERIERIEDYAGIAAAAVISLIFGVTFGWNYGTNNQVVYMIGALRLVNPGILAKDWFATQTTHYHPAFKYVAAALLACDPRGVAVGAAQTVVIAAGMVGVYFLIRSLIDRRFALAAFAVVIVVASITRTNGPCSIYVFDEILQPSSIGSAAFLISIPLFVQEKWLASGILLAVSGIFHANYAILFFGAYGLAHLALGKKDLIKRGIRQLGPTFVVLLLFLPMILGTAMSKDAAAAQVIYTTIRSPHHFVIAGHEREFVSFLGWTLLGLGLAAPLSRNPEGPVRRLATLIFGLMAVIWAGVGLSIISKMSQATQLFSWRIIPHVELVLVALSCALAMRALLEPPVSRRYGGLSLALIATGLGAISLWAAVLAKPPLVRLPVRVLVLAALARVIWELGRRYAPERARSIAKIGWHRGAPIIAALFFLYSMSDVLRPEYDQFKKRSNVYNGLGRSERELYAWMQENTPVDAVFLTPPDSENMRFHGRRAIVVDWKSNPIVPGEVLDWVKRLEDVIGKKLKSWRDLDGYANLDPERLKMLRERYGFDYVIVRKGNEKKLPGLTVLYSNGSFTVLDVRG